MLLVLIGCVLPLCAQHGATGLPSVVKFAGTLTSSDGQPLRGTVGVNFYLYAEQEGGAPLWMETQNVRPDSNGHYSAMLGSASAHGIPAEVFVGGSARWLSVQVSGEVEQARRDFKSCRRRSTGTVSPTSFRYGPTKISSANPFSARAEAT